jgi:hypothetical protein
MQPDVGLLNANQLIIELDRLGVNFLQGETTAAITAPLTPANVIIQLVMSAEARLRLALIPLLLRHPEFADDIRWVVTQVPPAAQLVIKCYYTAAHLLQQKYQSRLEALFGDSALLPDLFTIELGLPNFSTPNQGLQVLAERHRSLSGRAINWLGTYEHGAQRLLTHGERKLLWQKSQFIKSSV